MTEVRGAKNMAENWGGISFLSFEKGAAVETGHRKRVEGISRRRCRKIALRWTALCEAQLYVILSQILVKSAPYFFWGG